MAYMIQWVRSLIFNFTMYLALFVIGVLFFPWAMFSRHGALRACKTYAHWVRWSARWMIGLKTEIRGTPPTGEVMIGAKHQSFLDIIVIFSVVPAGKFIMKRELLWAPILGQYARWIGCVPVNRGKRGAAILQMVADVASGAQEPGQLIIYSQGTRVAPGVKKPYKIGTYALYKDLNQPCVPVATNIGVFWPRHGVYRKPGVAVVDFLEPIPTGMQSKAFMRQLEDVVETRSDALMREAGFDPDGTIRQ
ncbi:lysophospholipid acyltransferase family protein [Shimia abyssi]|uniref:1-acyl-sn-glycerol-3-phosphate acyltransferase n=1 Tax=Shimia abyssi TaxID=1662395 RepID=A0A2P8FES5_9RHOB|nr:lysophospholipid acyltransferase family protein [Shimia abyssi]PSL20194.1 1-acyl-sn-glycerol-3-phosphate acyltransferase [Shimia abyssi]